MTKCNLVLTGLFKLMVFWAITSTGACDEKSSPVSSRNDWDSYFKVRSEEEIRYKLSMTAPIFGYSEFEQVLRYKGNADGWYRFVQLYVGGPMDGEQKEVFLKTDKDGRWSRDAGDEKSLSIPYPLAIGQEWETSGFKYKFEKIEDFEASAKTFKGCILITKSMGENKTSHWYAKDLGEISLNGTTAQGVPVRKNMIIKPKE